MLRIFQHQSTPGLSCQLVGHLVIADCEQEFFGYHAGQCGQQELAFPGKTTISAISAVSIPVVIFFMVGVQ